MSLGHSPSIVTSGLQLCLDAANSKSYPGTGTTWTDLSGNGNNNTLTNGPTYSSSNNGSIVFDGTNDYVTRAASINTGQNFTVSVWANPTSVGTTRRCAIANGQNQTTDKGWYFSIGQGGGTNRFFLSIGTDQAYAISADNIVVPGVWQNFTGTVANGGSTINLYYNGTLVSNSSTISSSRTIDYSISTFYIGRRDLSSPAADYLTGNISQISIYNAVLTENQIEQNFNALRGRYSI